MQRSLFCLSVLLLMITCGHLLAQGNQPAATDTSQGSAQEHVLVEQSAGLLVATRQLADDSVHQARLRMEIGQLGAGEQKKKENLVRELEQLTAAGALRRLQLQERVDSLRGRVHGYGVTLFADTVFFIYARLGSAPPRERAAVIAQRIRALADDYTFSPDSLRVIPSELTLDIAYKDEVIASVSDLDALWNRTSTDTLAQRIRASIARAVNHYQEQTSGKTLVKEILIAVFVLVILGLLIFTVGRLFRWTRRQLEQQQGKALRGLRIRNYQVLDAAREVQFLKGVNTLVKWLVILVVIYLALPILFGLFPWTQAFAHQLINYFLAPVKKILRAVWDYVPNLVTVVVLVVFFRYLLKLFKFLKTEIENGVLNIPGFFPDWANPTYQILRALLLAFMLIVIFPYLPGADSPIFKGVSVFLGVIFTFGSAGALSNVVAGLVLTYMRAFRIGDRVKIGDAVGDVVEKSILVTRVRTIKNEVISIPNATVMSSFTTNYSSDAQEKGLVIHTTLTIGYDASWRTVHAIMIDAALATELIEKEPAPFVLQTSLDDFYVSYQLNAYTHAPNQQAIIYSQLHQHLQDKFNEAGVEIMSPHYGALRDGNKTTIPDNYLPKDYKTPGFNVQKPE